MEGEGMGEQSFQGSGREGRGEAGRARDGMEWQRRKRREARGGKILGGPQVLGGAERSAAVLGAAIISEKSGGELNLR